MNETKRTFIYVGVAVLSIGAAAWAHHLSRPPKDAEYVGIGTEFYPEFQDPTTAQMLRVVNFNEDTAAVKEFKVEYRDGKWQIPSHHNYPADGKDRLAQTAASVIGVNRGALVSRRKSDHPRYNVVDPENLDDAILKGRGDKITLAKSDGDVLAEYIVGKKVEGQTDVYYVRAPKKDGDAVYRAKLKIDLSTKFSDWIEPDLLKLNRDALTDVRIDNYSIDETQGVINPGEVSDLKKPTSADSWKLGDLKPAEELKTDVVNQLVNSIGNLRIVGVRPKPPGLNADLTLDPKFANSREMVFALGNDMRNRGFFVANDRRAKKTRVLSKEGELQAGTNEGVRYALQFGQIFTGSDLEIETGLSKDAEKAKAAAGDKKAGDKGDKAGADKAPKDDKAKDPAAASKDPAKKSRYLMVYASFDPTLAGEPPVKPTEPKKPPGIDAPSPAASGKDKADTKTDAKPAAPATPAPKSGDSSKPTPGGTSSPPAEDKSKKQSSSETLDDSTMLALALPDPPASTSPASKATETPATKPDKGPQTPPAQPTATGAGAKPSPGKAPAKAAAPTPPAKPDPKAEYQKALEQYKKDLEKYENDKSELEKKLKKGRETVKSLNERFAPWYYVISAESFENLRLSRSSLVKPKENPADKKPEAGGPQNPGLPTPGLPGAP